MGENVENPMVLDEHWAEFEREPEDPDEWYAEADRREDEWRDY